MEIICILLGKQIKTRERITSGTDKSQRKGDLLSLRTNKLQ